jgi:hypothetical protein
MEKEKLSEEESSWRRRWRRIELESSGEAEQSLFSC